MGVVLNEDQNKRLSNQQYSIVWQKLGEESQKTMHSVPTFDFLYVFPPSLIYKCRFYEYFNSFNAMIIKMLNKVCKKFKLIFFNH